VEEGTSVARGELDALRAARFGFIARKQRRFSKPATAALAYLRTRDAARPSSEGVHCFPFTVRARI